ncbi:hypothetical protein BDK51DRAFT_30948 [Blyttiomyces helicus]|uniref:Uncharacterized protein n=1 Tax=Blyttiomyces helicus TaxID=388810 RepID=A0A4P9W9L6_9FUNG|nr:hypothetical protein BDK51DRAFT_30948 [Blyttiomyces helicus]|eukprot:RKO87818.1 hypothetical protein BDK51DRAFT_30948 [Blyttiomyces helicus]
MKKPRCSSTIPVASWHTYKTFCKSTATAILLYTPVDLQLLIEEVLAAWPLSDGDGKESAKTLMGTHELVWALANSTKHRRSTALLEGYFLSATRHQEVTHCWANTAHLCCCWATAPDLNTPPAPLGMCLQPRHLRRRLKQWRWEWPRWQLELLWGRWW